MANVAKKNAALYGEVFENIILNPAALFLRIHWHNTVIKYCRCLHISEGFAQVSKTPNDYLESNRVIVCTQR